MRNSYSILFVCAAASQLGATNCGEVLRDPGFDLWCGGDLCAWKVERGEFFTDLDVRSANRVIVLGTTVADKLFPGVDPVGQMKAWRLGSVGAGQEGAWLIGVPDLKGLQQLTL